MHAISINIYIYMYTAPRKYHFIIIMKLLVICSSILFINYQCYRKYTPTLLFEKSISRKLFEISIFFKGLFSRLDELYLMTSYIFVAKIIGILFVKTSYIFLLFFLCSVLVLKRVRYITCKLFLFFVASLY